MPSQLPRRLPQPRGSEAERELLVSRDAPSSRPFNPKSSTWGLHGHTRTHIRAQTHVRPCTRPWTVSPHVASGAFEAPHLAQDNSSLFPRPSRASDPAGPEDLVGAGRGSRARAPAGGACCPTGWDAGRCGPRCSDGKGGTPVCLRPGVSGLQRALGGTSIHSGPWENLGSDDLVPELDPWQTALPGGSRCLVCWASSLMAWPSRFFLCPHGGSPPGGP